VNQRGTAVKRTPRMPPRRRVSRFGNALLGWELLRVSRRTGSLAIGRFAFGAALLGVLWILWSAEYAQTESFSGDVNVIAKQLQRFAESFSLTFFIVQLILVLLLTPIFVAGSVFEERETRSGEVLLTTDLTRREVFYGKFLARVVQVMMVVAAGMPVLALTLLWGGVAIEFIIVGYAATFFCIWSSGAIAASVAGSSETFREAVLKAYAYILVFNVLIFPASPFLLIPISREAIGGALCIGVIFFPVHFIVTLVSLSHGLRWLRLAMLRQRRRVTEDLAQQMARRKPPMADENPLLWKERYVGGDSEVVMNTVATASVVVVLGTLIVVVLGAGVAPAGWVTAYAAPILLLAVAAVIGLGAAGAVARERHKNTLIDLFMIPGGRREILRAKLMGAVWRGRWMLGAVGGLLIGGVLSGTPLVAMVPLALAAAAFVAFGAALGVWLSVRCRTALTANSAWIGIVALSLMGTYLLADALSYRVAEPNGGPAVKVYPEWSRVVNPVMAWQALAMNPEDDPAGGYNGLRDVKLRVLPDKRPKLMAPLAGLALYGMSAGVLWLLALRRFNREGREE
jgi:ABC-type transport system involved in multi-copper enzyme maturation permease subunit